MDRHQVSKNPYSGSSFDDFLEEEGILEEVSPKAQKRLMALQIEDILAESSLTKTEIAAKSGYQPFSA